MGLGPCGLIASVLGLPAHARTSLGHIRALPPVDKGLQIMAQGPFRKLKGHVSEILLLGLNSSNVSKI